jgi:hypothetical protein
VRESTVRARARVAIALTIVAAYVAVTVAGHGAATRRATSARPAPLIAPSAFGRRVVLNGWDLSREGVR